MAIETCRSSDNVSLFWPLLMHAILEGGYQWPVAYALGRHRCSPHWSLHVQGFNRIGPVWSSPHIPWIYGSLDFPASKDWVRENNFFSMHIWSGDGICFSEKNAAFFRKAVSARQSGSMKSSSYRMFVGSIGILLLSQFFATMLIAGRTDDCTAKRSNGEVPAVTNSINHFVILRIIMRRRAN